MEEDLKLQSKFAFTRKENYDILKANSFKQRH